MKNSILGTGMKFPPQINPATGKFVTVSEEESVKESIYLILMTSKTERFMRPDFGSRVISYTFGDTNNTMLTVMSREITEDLRNNEPRISDIQVQMDANSRPGCLLIYIDYILIATQTPGNLVFPFYLSNNTEDESEWNETVG